MNSNAPENPAAAARELWELDRQTEALTKDLVEVRRGLPPKRRAHRLAHARAVLSGTGTVEDRKRRAEEATIDEWFAVETDEQRLEALRDQLRDVRGRAEDLRSINSNLKVELRTMHMGGAA